MADEPLKIDEAQERESMRSVPSRYSDRQWVNIDENFARISFAEIIEGSAVHHTALKLHIDAAMSLATLIYDLAAKFAPEAFAREKARLEALRAGPSSQS